MGGLPFWWLGEGLRLFAVKTAFYEMLHRASDFEGFFGTTWERENGYEI
jgi:hypothetical protein